MTRARAERLSRVDPATADAWRALSRRALEPNPYFDVDFLRDAHRHLAPEVDPLVVTAWDGDDLVGVLPCVESPRWHGLPVRVRSTAPPLGSTMVDLHTPLLAPDAAVAASTALLSWATAGRGPVVLELPVLGADGEAWPALRQAARRLGASLRVWGTGVRGAVVPTSPARVSPAPTGPVGPGPVPVPVDALVAHLSASRRKSVRRTAAALAAAHGPLTWCDRSADPAAVEEVVRMEAAGWKGRPERGGQGIEVLDGGTTWWRGLTARLRAADRLLVGELAAGGKPVFLTVTYREGDRWFGGRDVYAEDLREYGPGVLGRLAEAWWAREQGAVFDSCVNPAVYPDIARLYPDRRAVVSVVVSRGLLGRGVLAAAVAAHERRRARET
ncbi:GNAT family N-acetyltransferase [Isoptericola sp. NPDC057191]|uniref:GNAT family N-acetyltransferase n=1 Tax=Isoptericola sp. NPDC057191 TaxID=3346041 RepID=UPI003626C7CE